MIRAHMHVVYSKISIVVLSLALVCSFGLHAVQVEHTHAGEHHTHNATTKNVDFQNMNSEYLHFGDKKVFLVVVLATTLLSIFFLPRSWGVFWREFHRVRFNNLRSRMTSFLVHCHSYLHTLFTRGILHAKYYVMIAY